MVTLSQNVLIFVSNTSQLIGCQFQYHWLDIFVLEEIGIESSVAFLKESFSIICIKRKLQTKSHISSPIDWYIYEPHRDKTNKVSVRPAKTQISLGMCSMGS